MTIQTTNIGEVVIGDPSQEERLRITTEAVRDLYDALMIIRNDRLIPGSYWYKIATNALEKVSSVSSKP